MVKIPGDPFDKETWINPRSIVNTTVKRPGKEKAAILSIYTHKRYFRAECTDEEVVAFHNEVTDLQITRYMDIENE